MAGGVRSVLASHWSLADRETVPLIWDFYGHLFEHDPAGALARAQRDALGRGDGSPLFWAPLALFGEPSAPGSRRLVPRWWPRLRRRRFRAHCDALRRRFDARPIPERSGSPGDQDFLRREEL
jgi:hypothetical protein